MSRKTNTSEFIVKFTARVLLYEGDGQWVAHCLETDLVGYGKTPQSSLDNLIELTEMQLSFALFKQDPGLLDRPAPPHILEMYYNLQRESMRNLVSKRKKQDKSRLTASIPLSPPTGKTDFCVASN